MESYRRRIYDRYLTTTYAPRNDLTDEGLARTAAAYARDFGPHLPADREAPILEIGCGSGAFLDCCRQLGYRDVRGIDVSPEQVELCRDRGFAEVACSDALDYLRGGDGRFSLVVLSDVLEHLPKSETLATLEAVHARLLPGGRVLVRVPNLSNPLNVRTRYVDFTHETGFTSESLRQVLTLAGFEVETVYGSFSFHRRWLARWLFDHLLWRAFTLFVRHTLHLKYELARGKNLIAVGSKRAP